MRTHFKGTFLLLKKEQPSDQQQLPMENISSCDDSNPFHISEDVLIQILVLLPFISLLRFKSVCKSWRAIIQSSLFIHLHPNITTTPNNNFGTFIFQTSNRYGTASASNNCEAFLMLSGGGGGEKEDSEEEEEEIKLENLGFPPIDEVSLRTHSDDVFMVGSCNGLICIHDATRKEVSLWNPATRQFRILPKSLTLAASARARVPPHLEQDFVAFGYDVKTNDYKVLQISCFKPSRSGGSWYSVKKYIFQVQVYSLSTDSWRLLEGINSLPAFPQQDGVSLNHGVYLKNGSYYFLGMYYPKSVTDQNPSRNMILSFDFTKEIFTTIKHPHDYQHEMFLTCFGEKLAIFVRVVVKEEDESDDSKIYDIWVLNKHGAKEEESWTKLHSTVPYFFGSRTPRAISNSGEFALLANVDYTFNNNVREPLQLQLFNLVTKEIKKVVHTGYRVIRADVYKQSLVSIGGNDTTVNNR